MNGEGIKKTKKDKMWISCYGWLTAFLLHGSASSRGG
jgi:hypothetical protein